MRLTFNFIFSFVVVWYNLRNERMKKRKWLIKPSDASKSTKQCFFSCALKLFFWEETTHDINRLSDYDKIRLNINRVETGRFQYKYSPSAAQKIIHSVTSTHFFSYFQIIVSNCSSENVWIRKCWIEGCGESNQTVSVPCDNHQDCHGREGTISVIKHWVSSSKKDYPE